MDLDITILSEVSQTKTSIMWYSLEVKSKKNYMSELIYKRLTDLKKKLMANKGNSRGVG